MLDGPVDVETGMEEVADAAGKICTFENETQGLPICLWYYILYHLMAEYVIVGSGLQDNFV